MSVSTRLSSHAQLQRLFRNLKRQHSSLLSILNAVSPVFIIHNLKSGDCWNGESPLNQKWGTPKIPGGGAIYATTSLYASNSFVICHLSSILFYFILSNHPVLLFQWFRFNKRISIKSLIEIYLRPPCKKYLRVSSCFEQLYRPRFTSQTTIACEERIFVSILALISFLRAIRICFNALKRV